MKPSENPPLEASLSREAYWGTDFYAREQAAIFWDQWFYAGRADAFRATGEYRVLDVAGESVILVRGEDGFHALLNFCRHRGTRLLCGEGTIRGAIRCPYHSWAYALDGTLIATPFVADEAVPPESRRLHRAGVAEWAGFLFLHLSPERAEASGSTLASQLGAIPERVQRYPLAELRVARTIRYEVAANWKVLLENYNECYHCAGVHPELCRLVPAFARGGQDLEWEDGIPHRDGAWTFTTDGTSKRAPFPDLDDAERVRHKGELVYPNLMLSLSAEHVAAFVLTPLQQDRTRIDCLLLFAPDEVSKPDFDPSDAAELWDLVNSQDWAICESVQRGMSSRAYRSGWFAPMEDESLDIRRWLLPRLEAP